MEITKPAIKIESRLESEWFRHKTNINQSTHRSLVTCGGAYKIMHVKRDAYIFQCIIGHEVKVIFAIWPAKYDNIIRLF